MFSQSNDSLNIMSLVKMLQSYVHIKSFTNESDTSRCLWAASIVEPIAFFGSLSYLTNKYACLLAITISCIKDE